MKWYEMIAGGLLFLWIFPSAIIVSSIDYPEKEPGINSYDSIKYDFGMCIGTIIIMILILSPGIVANILCIEIGKRIDKKLKLVKLI